MSSCWNSSKDFVRNTEFFTFRSKVKSYSMLSGTYKPFQCMLGAPKEWGCASSCTFQDKFQIPKQNQTPESITPCCWSIQRSYRCTAEWSRTTRWQWHCACHSRLKPVVGWGCCQWVAATITSVQHSTSSARCSCTGITLIPVVWLYSDTA